MVEIAVNNKRTLEGEVVSDKMDKTIVVQVTRILRHPVLGKTIRRVKKYKVHDELNSATSGDWVEIRETRPLSKHKHMELVKVVRSATGGQS